jgi:hypothetical protein
MSAICAPGTLIWLVIYITAMAGHLATEGASLKVTHMDGSMFVAIWGFGMLYSALCAGLSETSYRIHIYLI